MKKLRALGIGLILTLLLMTACGGETASGNPSGDWAKGQEQIVGTAATEESRQGISQESEPEALDSDSAASSPVLKDKLPEYGSYYYDVENVVLYLTAYEELPPNYITKNEARELGWDGGSVEDYLEGAAIGGDVFGNREGLLPEDTGRIYTECDIDTDGYSSRGSRRLVFSNDGLYFYTSDHYETFSEVTVTEDYEVIW